jgi:replication-associated recombination protein RarA
MQEKFGLLGQVFWLAGPSGTGKTTIARLIAAECADEFATEEVDAQDVTLDTLREWERRCSIRPLTGQGYAFIVNEAHGLSSRVVSRLQTVLEDRYVSKNSTWVFTTTLVGQKRLFDSKLDACPFLSRAVCLELEFTSAEAMAFANRVQQVAVTEGLDGKPLDAYVQLILECKGNMRQALQRVASGEMLE